MTSIYDMLCKIPAMMRVSLSSQRKARELMCFKDVTQNLQMVFYWLRSAEADLKLVEEQSTIEEGEVVERSLTPPTLISVFDELNYVQEETSRLAEMIERYLGDATLPPSVEYKMKQGYNRVMEAMFSNEICKTHYEEYAKLKSGREQ